MAMNVLGLMGWFGAWLTCVISICGWYRWWVLALLGTAALYSFYRSSVQLRYFTQAAHLRNILTGYPWRRLDEAAYGLSNHPEAAATGMWVEVPHPADPTQRIPLLFRNHERRNWWLTRMAPGAKPEKRAQLEPLWFAGDPRFFGVVAVTGRRGAPKRLYRLSQPGVFHPRARAERRDASGEDIDRARRAGAYIRD